MYPATATAVVPIYRMGNDYNGPTIFMGDITTWDDPEILADNPELRVTDPIKVVVREDGSGTTEIFPKALSDDFARDIGVSTLPDWPSSFQKSDGTDGVAAAVFSESFSIGLVVLSDAKESGLDYATMRNRAGELVEASANSRLGRFLA